jgi:hypothetical protein
MAKTDRVPQDAASALAGGRPLTDAEILAQIPGARARAAEEQKHGLRAAEARYSAARHQLHIGLANGTVIGVPVDIVLALRGASPRELGGVEVSPTGSALHWERLDVDLSVPALVREALGDAAIQSLFGVMGGRATSSRKAEAARANGAKGGRPRGRGTAAPKTSKHTHRKAAPGVGVTTVPARPHQHPGGMKVAAKRAGSPAHPGASKTSRLR